MFFSGKHGVVHDGYGDYVVMPWPVTGEFLPGVCI